MAEQTLGEYIAAEVQKALDAAYHDTKGARKDVADSGGHTAAQGIVGDIGHMTGMLSALPFIGGLIGDVLGPVEKVIGNADDEGGKLGTAFGMGYIGGYLMYQMIQPATRPVSQHIESIFQSQVDDPHDLADQAARGLLNIEAARSEAHKSGWDSGQLDRAERVAEQRPGLAQLLDLHNRGLASTTLVDNALQLEGYNSGWRDILPLLARSLLSPADLALAVLRGEITQDEGTAYAGKLGVVPEDFNTLVLNTGEPIGLMELLEAYRRGFIDEQRLVHGVRQSRVRNEWIDVVERLRFEPMSTADAVRAVVEHYITQEEGQVIANQNGLKPEHFPTLVESWGRPLAHEQMGSLYHRGLATREQFDQAMRESNLKNKYIDQSFDLTRRLIPERLIVTGIHYGAITLQEGAKRLLALGYNQEDTNLLLRTGLAEHKQTRHDLTRSQIVTLYEDHVLSKAEALKHLVALGFTEADSNYMVQIADIAAHAKEVRAEVMATRNAYLAGGIDHDKAVAEQVQVGIDRAQAEHNVTLWDREKRRAARSLTVAQIVKAAKENTISYDHALKLLEASGYSGGDASTILYSQGVVVGSPASFPPGAQPRPGA